MSGLLTITNPHARRHVDRRPYVWGLLYAGCPVRCHHDREGKLDDYPYHVDRLVRCTFTLALALWAAEWDGQPQPAVFAGPGTDLARRLRGGKA